MQCSNSSSTKDKMQYSKNLCGLFEGDQFQVQGQNDEKEEQVVEELKKEKVGAVEWIYPPDKWMKTVFEDGEVKYYWKTRTEFKGKNKKGGEDSWREFKELEEIQEFPPFNQNRNQRGSEGDEGGHLKDNLGQVGQVDDGCGDQKVDQNPKKSEDKMSTWQAIKIFFRLKEV